jgi:hypothetical protein
MDFSGSEAGKLKVPVLIRLRIILPGLFFKPLDEVLPIYTAFQKAVNHR